MSTSENIEMKPFVMAADKVDEFLNEKPDEETLKKISEIADKFERVNVITADDLRKALELSQNNSKALPDDVALEPEYILRADGSIKITGFSLVKKEK